MKARLYTLFLLICAITAGGSFAQCPGTYGPNLIVNGDFSAGATGFTSDYGVYYQTCPLLFPKMYMVTNAPCNFEITGDHTSGTGNAMYVNGDANDADAIAVGRGDASFEAAKVWSQTVAVTPNTLYTLSAWMANATDEAHCGCGSHPMA